MANELTIRDSEGVLIITAKQGRSAVNGILGALAGGTFVAIAFHNLLGTPALIITTAIVAVLSLFLGMREQHAELRVTNLALTSKGRYGDSLWSKRSVSAADVRWLEYQQDSTGPETSHHPGGLYAVLSNRNICILPYVDEHQAADVIQRIVERFPDLRGRWEGQSPFGQHFTSLGLGPKAK
jgi:hypothetical protein